ncbi:MAG: polyprenol monophosphomannose synthase [Microthrixaceae bacterium]|nr:polyprenol monophosphomannose synthase [Microthrixaceae bacterium]MCB1011063.1 polyprenol monophosphomannose synthase [Microthrixaceae bacterium]MCB9386700.1 polyprenol monophosphomannose synthase [Microthrixaceae bacterium]MCO5319929.1 polyprenol monophosphomannose synthase [Microthrixaceae bacterium]
MSRVLVVPTYQEAENVERLIRAVRETAPELSILIVDDNSPDGTGELAEKVGIELGRVEVLHRAGKAGLGAAYRHGFRHALDGGHDVIVQMDADMSHDPAVLPTLLAAIDDGADVAVGSRYVPGGSVPNWTLFRRTLSHWGNSYARWMLKLRMNDATTAFRAYRREVLERIDIDGTTANGYLFQIETAFRLSMAGVSVAEIPITFVDRVAGASKMAVGRTMVETELRVTWWGLSLRAPGLSNRFRGTGAGRFLHSKVRPSGIPMPAEHSEPPLDD